MPSSMNWYIENRVIYIRLWGDATITEMESRSVTMMGMLDSGKPLVHLILDDSQLKSTPTSLGQLRKSLPFLRHPSLGWVLAVGQVNAVFNFLTSLLASVFRIRHRRFDTLAEAIDFLKSVDASIDWTQANSSVLGYEKPAG